MWIARDKDGSLTVFVEKPYCSDGCWRSHNAINVDIYPSLYPEVTFENSPKELIVKPTNV